MEIKFYELVKQGEIKTVKLGGKTIITANEADRFISKLEQSAA